MKYQKDKNIQNTFYDHNNYSNVCHHETSFDKTPNQCLFFKQLINESSVFNKNVDFNIKIMPFYPNF